MHLFPPRFGTVTLLSILFLIAGVRGAVLSAAETPGVDPRPQRRDPWAQARAQMVEYEVAGAGVEDPRVLEAIRATPRHEFIPTSMRRYANLDMAVPIGAAQTISSPFIVAYMTERLQPQTTDKILEIGTGSGYQAAVLSGLVSEVYSIEIVESLGRRAARTLQRLGYDNVKTKIGDGYQGWTEHAPFDKIIVTCSPEKVPKPLVEQLEEGGLLVVPLGQRYQQTLYLFRKVDGVLQPDPLRPTFFVPMVGRADEERAEDPDLLEPALINGDFEATLRDKPAGWYYARQATLDPNGRTPGNACLTFRNDTPGRSAQAMQPVGIDGRKTRAVDLSAWVRGSRVQRGPWPGQAPDLAIVFFNAERHPVHKQSLGPWTGTFDWTETRRRVDVPRTARFASVEVGLWGGTGELSIDDVTLGVVARPAAK